jgi:cell division protease FtsH
MPLPGQPSSQSSRFAPWVFLALGVLFAFQWVLAGRPQAQTIAYSEFEQALAGGKVAEVHIGPDRITGDYKNPPAGSPAHFTTIRVDPDLAGRLKAAGVKFSGEPGPGLLEKIIGWLLPTVGLVLVWLFVLGRMGSAQQGGLLSIGKNRAKLYVEKDIGVTFADVAGVDEAKEELREVIAFLRNPKDYGRLGARVPKGILLVGSPGTGKTLLARAVAGEAGVAFFSISGSEFVELFVGVGAARVRDLFDQARKNAPCIIFIDELDALGRARGVGPFSGSHDEKEQTLNQLLSELDGFDPSVGVVLLAATNRPEILDPALLRAGRFDRQILVDRPDKAGRLQILRVHLKKVRLSPAVNVEDIAALTPGFTGADLANLVNEAALLATRRNAATVEGRDLTEALERIVAGLEKKSRLLNPRERRVVAYHETGHALVALVLPDVDPVQKVTIIPRGIGALGYTMQRPTDDRFLLGKSELADRMAVLLGGRTAEELVFGEVSTGAADDLEKATDIARSMVMRYGMAPPLGPVSYEHAATPLLGPAADAWQQRQYGETTAAAIDLQVKAFIEDAQRRAQGVLQKNRAILEQTAERLLVQETLTAEDLAEVRARLAAREAREASDRTLALAPP